ncbi:phage tail protein [Sphingosinicella sp. LHD-64]|uniref:GTA baseplate fiber-binding domain-containing protein n=1 Tax=Sphingosinicella sp. LHD-64 TaxID=3072139 RepID=UPI00280F2F59|nr:phage tail protein [Sphingosinicella sp. LHD-64]MDQ8757855.1 phage tail protein [Sphingosinicella sp. LHD-64]
MATLVLTAVGSAIGGPIGGAIGSILGQQIDNSLFAPKARQGSRLGSLAVQTSAYGTDIPRIFGMIRVAGTVIWATDLVESRSTSSGGKGRPKTISYSYSANFAVALSARPIRTVRRIWADGKLLRGSAGDFKTQTGYRLHAGDEDQDADPLIAAAEGATQAPAFRGLAYAVFENFQLEDYGNRIPSLSFEVEADEAPVTIGAIAEALAGPALAADAATPLLHGYAAGGDSVRNAVEALADIAALSLVDRNGRLWLGSNVGSPVPVDGAGETARRQMTRRALATLPGEVSIAYYDTARDYQAGLQRALAGAPDGRVVERRDVPAALSAGAAKGLAEGRLAVLRTGRTRANLSLGWAYAALRPGNDVILSSEAGLWRVRRWTSERMSIALELVRIGNGFLHEPATATPGNGVRQPDLVHGPTTLRVFDLPLGEPQGAQPSLLVAAAGIEDGWRRAALMASFDDGASWQDAGVTAPAATMGTALTALGTGNSALFDEVASLEVELLNETMWLESAGDDALANGANLALVGSELIQFGSALWLGGRRFRLRHLLRGRRGTEWAAAAHISGDPFALIERESLATIDAPIGAAGASARVTANGVGDDEPVSIDLSITAEALRPPAPVHLEAERLTDGGVLIRWIRRSRLGWTWLSDSDTPLGEESESYRLLLSGEGFERVVTLSSASHVYSAADQVSDGWVGALHIAVAQIGTHAVSRPAEILFE